MRYLEYHVTRRGRSGFPHVLLGMLIAMFIGAVVMVLGAVVAVGAVAYGLFRALGRQFRMAGGGGASVRGQTPGGGAFAWRDVRLGRGGRAGAETDASASTQPTITLERDGDGTWRRDD